MLDPKAEIADEILFVGATAMDRDQQREWYDLEQLAEHRLRDGARLVRPGTKTDRVIQLLVLPSFSTRSSYELYRLRQAGASEYVGVQLAWELEVDQQKLATPVDRLKHAGELQPTLTTRSATIAPT